MSWFSFFLAFPREKPQKHAATLNTSYSLWLHRKLWLMVCSYRCYMSTYIWHLLYGFRLFLNLFLSCFCHQEEAKWRMWRGVRSKKLKHEKESVHHSSGGNQLYFYFIFFFEGSKGVLVNLVDEFTQDF